ncbi:NAD-dependent epimerase/dehydratase family protein [Alphaproteobacteria bacterium]|nr:NAD-dependent epimerase/dehydratase family protein [Alphaproteobacteria bacterium]
MDFNRKNVLITGASGMIGRALVEKMLKLDAQILAVDLFKPNEGLDNVTYKSGDLREYSFCREIMNGIDIVFHVAGIKGSPQACMESPADFFVPMIQFNTNVLEAARHARVKAVAYTSSIGVYTPSKLFKEDELWSGLPSKNDWFGGWAKRIGEMQADAYRIQYEWNGIKILRPANVYGRFDNFNLNGAMVIPALIHKASEAKNKLDVFGDGTAVRDFIHAEDVADGLIFSIANNIDKPMNLGSGRGHPISQIASLVVKHTNPELEINWLGTKFVGDDVRIMDCERAQKFGFIPKISIENGIKDTILWFKDNKKSVLNRFDAFKK